MHLANTSFTYGDRARYFGAIVIIDGPSAEGTDRVNVRWDYDQCCTTWAAKIEHLKPITSEETTNATVH